MVLRLLLKRRTTSVSGEFMGIIRLGFFGGFLISLCLSSFSLAEDHGDRTSGEEPTFRHVLSTPKSDPTTEELKSLRAAFRSGTAAAQRFADKDSSAAVECVEDRDFPEAKGDKTPRSFAGLLLLHEKGPAGAPTILLKTVKSADTLEKLKNLSAEEIEKLRTDPGYKFERDLAQMNTGNPVKDGSLSFDRKAWEYSLGNTKYEVRSVKDPESGKNTVMIKVSRYETRTVSYQTNDFEFRRPSPWEEREYKTYSSEHLVSETYCH